MSVPRLAIGPANHAGQAYAWAQAVNQNLPAQAWSFAERPTSKHAFGFDIDRPLSVVSLRNPLARKLRSRLLFRDTTHIALDGFRTYFRARRRGKLRGDAQWLARRGWMVALVAHGTDTRSPERHMERLDWSYFRDGTPEWRSAISATAAENRATAESAGIPVFYSTPDLGLDLPHGTWLPVCIDVDSWSYDVPPLERVVPRVVHVPSHSVIKGTPYIAKVMSELDERGLIEFVTPGKMPHSEMKALIQSADVVIDQVLSGYYGVAAVEAMAAGRVLISSLADDVAALMPEAPQFLDADPSTLKSVMQSVLERRDEMRQRAEHNRRFVRRWHDGTESARRLAPFLGVEPS